MASFLDKNEKRDLEILYFLYSEDKTWSIEQLASLANCSIKSVSSTISKLNELISNYDLNCWIQIEKHTGVKLWADSYISIYQLENIYIKNTITYQLINKLFHEKNLSIIKLQNFFFLSRSSIYRKLAVIEKLVQNNGFNFSKTELTITGSESNIREFFYLFYISLIDDHLWPFETVSRTYLEEKLNKIEQISKFKLSYSEKIRILYRMAVNTVRYQQKHYIVELPEIVQIAPNLESELVLAKKYILDGIPVEHHQLEYDYLSLVYLTYANTIEVNNLLGIDEAVAWNKEKKTEAYMFVSELFSRITRLYPQLDLKKYFSSSLFIYKLISVTNYALLHPNINVDLNLNDRWNKRFRSVMFSSINRPKFTEVLWESIVDIHDKSPKEMINPHHIFYFIYSVFSQFVDLYLFENPLNIKLIMEAGYLSENVLKDKLSRFLGDDVKIVISNIRHDETVSYDLVISDLLSLTIDYTKAKHQYIWVFPPVERDWQNIKMIIETLRLSST